MKELKDLFDKTPFNTLPKLLDEYFIWILGKAYELRYYDDVEAPITIGFLVNQFLGELDYTVDLIERLLIRKNEKGEILDSPCRRQIKLNDPDLSLNNYILLNVKKKEFMNRVTSAYALHVDPKVIGAEIDIRGTNVTPHYEGKMNPIRVNNLNG